LSTPEPLSQPSPIPASIVESVGLDKALDEPVLKSLMKLSAQQPGYRVLPVSTVTKTENSVRLLADSTKHRFPCLMRCLFHPQPPVTATPVHRGVVSPVLQLLNSMDAVCIAVILTTSLCFGGLLTRVPLAGRFSLAILVTVAAKSRCVAVFQ
jgi:hypothetical protein